jgi:reticulon-4-interacting protein 1, mitochondrial
MEDPAQTSLLTMRAWTHKTTGPPGKVLALQQDIPRPSLTSPTQVLVRIKYAALNPAGSVLMQLCPSFLRTQPCIPELDFAGEIVQIGDGVNISRGLIPGLDVFGSIPVSDHLKGQGSLSEYVVLDSEFVSIAPKGMALHETAGLPVAGCTALSVIRKAELRPAQRVLVNGAAGGIGSLVLQMVRAAVGDQGHVVAICSTVKEPLMRELGANEVCMGVLVQCFQDLLAKCLVGL